MRIRLFTLSTLLLAAGALVVAQQPKQPARAGMTLTSPAFPDGGEIPAKFTQLVPMPISPKLEWTNVPDGVVSFVLIMHDPDVAKNRTTEDQLHWLVVNIPGTARELPENVPLDPQLPDGSIQGKNGGGVVGYRGPGAPAPGPHHHYTWELFALNAKLDVGNDPSRADVLKAMDGHILAKAVYAARFHR